MGRFFCFLTLVLWLPLIAQSQNVDVKLVVAVDASGSVDPTELRLQIDGIAAALRHRAVQNTVRNGLYGRVAVAMLVWSDAAYPKYPTKWHILDSPETFEVFALEVETYNISAPGVPAIGGGGTNIGDALVYAISMLEENPARAPRWVVDISGDGPESKPWQKGAIELPEARIIAQQRAITVNGLAIETDIADLNEYYRSNVITGPGSFVIRARDFQDFQRAIIDKLLRELMPVAVSDKITPPVRLAQLSQCLMPC